VNLTSFFLGLAIGGVGILLYRAWLQARLQYRLSQPNLRNPAQPQTRGFSLNLPLFQAIGELQQQNQQLAAEVLGWKQLINHSPMGYLQVDEDNQLLDCNPQALKLLNIQDLNIQDYQETPPRLLLELVRSYELDQLIEATRNQQIPCQKDWIFQPVTIDVVNVPVQSACPLRGYAFPMAHDQVAVLLESRQEATMLSQQRDRWTSDVAHELKTPLTSIRLVAETLQNRVEPSLRQWIERLLKEVIRLSTLVQEILDLSQLEGEAHQQLKLAPIDLPQLIQSAWQNLELLSHDRRIHLDYQGPAYMIIQGDEARFFRVLINLLANSLKYSADQQAIQVRLKLLDTNPAQVQLDVIDAGCGFPETDLPFVFERFYRGDPARARSAPVHTSQVRSVKTAGTALTQTNQSAMQLTATQLSSGSGLGLAIVRQIIERHQGTIIAKNHPETGGAWLQITLPQVPR
jgi:two-component system, OmpR family, phosphate regulon sensor histidine kinase PhoR